MENQCEESRQSVTGVLIEGVVASLLSLVDRDFLDNPPGGGGLCGRGCGCIGCWRFFLDRSCHAYFRVNLSLVVFSLWPERTPPKLSKSLFDRNCWLTASRTGGGGCQVQVWWTVRPVPVLSSQYHPSYHWRPPHSWWLWGLNNLPPPELCGRPVPDRALS